MSDEEAQQWAMFCHLSALFGYIIPFGNVIGPLIFWTMKKNEHPFIDDQGREALNFQINVLIWIVVCLLLMLVIIGFFLLLIVGFVALVLIVIAAIKANSGERYRYPFTIRFV